MNLEDAKSIIIDKLLEINGIEEYHNNNNSDKVEIYILNSENDFIDYKVYNSDNGFDIIINFVEDEKIIETNYTVFLTHWNEIPIFMDLNPLHYFKNKNFLFVENERFNLLKKQSFENKDSIIVESENNFYINPLKVKEVKDKNEIFNQIECFFIDKKIRKVFIENIFNKIEDVIVLISIFKRNKISFSFLSNSFNVEEKHKILFLIKEREKLRIKYKNNQKKYYSQNIKYLNNLELTRILN